MRVRYLYFGYATLKIKRVPGEVLLFLPKEKACGVNSEQTNISFVVWNGHYAPSPLHRVRRRPFQSN